MTTNSSKPPMLGFQTQMVSWLCIDEAFYRRFIEVMANRKMGEAHHQLVVDCVARYWENNGNTLPDIKMLRSLLATQLQEELAVAELGTSVSDQYAHIESTANPTLDTEEDYIQYDGNQARLANKTLDNLIAHLINEDTVRNLQRGKVDISDALKQAQDSLLQAHATNDDRYASTFGESLDNRKMGRFIPTSHPIVDLYSGGTGPATGDIIGHAAPRGSGKSTFANQIAVTVARNERMAAEREGRKPKIVYIFNYEKVEDPLAHTLSFSSNIKRNIIEDWVWNRDNSVFSQGRDYKDYEKELFSRQIALCKQGKSKDWPLTELERFNRARRMLDANIIVGNFSGSEPAHTPLAVRFVDGVREFIDGHQLKIGNPGVEAVFVDYAGTCVRAHMRVINRVGDNTERKLIEDLPFRFKYDVANPLGCFVWVSHQLAAEEASRRPGSRPDPNKFKDCKAFAENCDFCFVNGLPTREGYAVFVHSKSRRGSSQPDIVGHLKGDFCNWQSADDTHVILNGSIISKDELPDMGLSEVGVDEF